MDGIVISNWRMVIDCVALTLARAVVLTLDDPHPAGRREPQNVHHGIYTDTHGGWAFLTKGAGRFGASIALVACGAKRARGFARPLFKYDHGAEPGRDSRAI